MSLCCRYFYIYIKLLNVKYRVMEATRIEISSLFHAGFRKTKISKQLNVSRMTVQRVEQRLKASESLKNRLRSGRLQVICQEASKSLRIQRMPENDKTGTEEENFFSTVSRIHELRTVTRRNTISWDELTFS